MFQKEWLQKELKRISTLKTKGVYVLTYQKLLERFYQQKADGIIELTLEPQVVRLLQDNQVPATLESLTNIYESNHYRLSWFYF